MKRRNIGVVAALSAGVRVAGLGFSAPASASNVNNLTVNITGDGSTGRLSTHDVHQGYLTLKVNDDTAAHQGVTFTVVQPRPGHSIGEVLKAIDLQLGDNPAPADAARSTRILNNIALAFGGADTENAAEFRSDTVFLPKAGDYYVVVAGNTAAVNIGKIHADSNGDGNKPVSQETLFVGNGDTDTFGPAGLTIPSSGTLRVENNSDSIHLMQMSKVADGTTDAEVQAEFDAFMNNTPPTSDPAGLNSPPQDAIGVDAITPHNAAYLNYANLPKGDYLVLCFIADDVTGVPHAFMGMHLVLHVS